MSVNIDNAVVLLTQCLADAQDLDASQIDKTYGERVATSLVRAVKRSRLRALDIQ